ncbi:DNA phosphorothioation-associated DGQHR protein 1 [Ensifer sp. ENS03]|uniref:DNA phosphorothioation-associated DGQHR protein 1 n=1 Tax=Ensifer sp. ENS03 TaxID=2769283 RepID=UPI00178138B2|nr:DGQHR domain-containing protein [Ensifer sp. ENS03]
MNTSYPLQVPALRVEQPLGAFYAVVLSARTLLDLCFTEALRAEKLADGETYEVTGTQRLRQPKRLNEIANYINRDDSAFPNSIILAANYREDGRVEGEADNEADEQREFQRRWSVEEKGPGCYVLTIPSPERLAAIIDGQHRLFAFGLASAEHRDDQLLCSVYIDLPKPLQAHIFATINSTQKPVDKSLTYELFGYNLEDEPSSRWSPEKLAVFLTRRLGSDKESPMFGRIAVAPQNDFRDEQVDRGHWRVSTAVLVQGILRLISSNPKADSNALFTKDSSIFAKPRTRADIKDLRRDRSPLRDLYIEENDQLLYKIVENFLSAADQLFWQPAAPRSFILKTVGIQALLDVLRLIAPAAIANRNATVESFENRLRSAAHIDFSEDLFRNASGSGRSVIRNRILDAIGS